MEPTEVTTQEVQDEEKKYDQSLRPSSLGDFVGQQKLKNNLTISIQAAKKRGEPLEHVLFYGPPGLGKTTLAHIIARETDSQIKVTSGPAIERAGDLAAILTNLEEGDVLFIDEIHRLNKTIEEVLYPAMEDYALDIVVGKGPSARTLRLELPKFTLIGATTKLSMIAAPMRDRFGGVWRLEYYNDEDMQSIVNRTGGLLNASLEQEASAAVAKRARKTPRIANRLLKHVRDYAEVHGTGIVTHDLCNKALDLLAVDHVGLDEIDRRLLEVMIDTFNGGPVGLSSLAALTGEEMSTIETVYEPYLMQIGFITRTPRGRVVTQSGYAHVGKEMPPDMV